MGLVPHTAEGHAEQTERKLIYINAAKTTIFRIAQISEVSQSEHMGEDWSDKELETCVLQYWKACKNGGQNHAIDRSAFIKGALRDGLKSRGEGSVQRRMCNLSAIMEAHGRPYVIGWKPLPNVGANMTPKIEAMMRQRGLI